MAPSSLGQNVEVKTAALLYSRCKQSCDHSPNVYKRTSFGTSHSMISKEIYKTPFFCRVRMSNIKQTIKFLQLNGHWMNWCCLKPRFITWVLCEGPCVLTMRPCSTLSPNMVIFTETVMERHFSNLACRDFPDIKFLWTGIITFPTQDNVIIHLWQYYKIHTYKNNKHKKTKCKTQR